MFEVLEEDEQAAANIATGDDQDEPMSTDNQPHENNTHTSNGNSSSIDLNGSVKRKHDAKVVILCNDSFQIVAYHIVLIILLQYLLISWPRSIKSSLSGRSHFLRRNKKWILKSKIHYWQVHFSFYLLFFAEKMGRERCGQLLGQWHRLMVKTHFLAIFCFCFFFMHSAWT